jgi:hypothetical protein
VKKPFVPPEAREARRKQVVALTAQGMTRKQVAATMNVTDATIRVDLYKPGSQAELKDLRDQFKSYVMAQTQQGVVQGAYGVVRQAIEDKDAKSLELSTRAVVNLDKLTASASGETQRVEVTGIPPVTNVDLKVLIQNLLGRDVLRDESRALPLGT